MKTQEEAIAAITPGTAYKEALSGAIILDIREKMFTGYKQFDVPSVVYVPFSLLSFHYHQLSKETMFILADSSGLHVREAGRFLKQLGFRNLKILAGGIVEWEKDSLPLKENISERLTGTCVCMLRPRDKKDKQS